MPLCSSRRLISSLCSFFNKDGKVLKKRKAKWSVAVTATESGFDMILDLNLVWYNLIFFCICCPTGDMVVVALPVSVFLGEVLGSSNGIKILLYQGSTCFFQLVSHFARTSQMSHCCISMFWTPCTVVLDIEWNICILFHNGWGLKSVMSNYFNYLKVDFGHLLCVWNTFILNPLKKSVLSSTLGRKNITWNTFVCAPPPPQPHPLKILILEDT